ncbi:hypothetical protein T12_4214 [Trichinella patagoniensis]|uniref:Uncharacterized protein n=1 Tax=Trichinella patagoniensis TaxID=990121 RepID=A0A0V0ZFK6_9BILA|nr:hypothetical protein T12_4214 [Trichinella patagoniensis]
MFLRSLVFIDALFQQQNRLVPELIDEETNYFTFLIEIYLRMSVIRYQVVRKQRPASILYFFGPDVIDQLSPSRLNDNREPLAPEG